MGDNKSVSGVSLSQIWGEPLMHDLAETVWLCKEGKLKPHIDSTYPFSRVAEAHQRLEQRLNTGKVLLMPVQV